MIGVITMGNLDLKGMWMKMKTKGRMRTRRKKDPKKEEFPIIVSAWELLLYRK